MFAWYLFLFMPETDVAKNTNNIIWPNLPLNCPSKTPGVEFRIRIHLLAKWMHTVPCLIKLKWHNNIRRTTNDGLGLVKFTFKAFGSCLLIKGTLEKKWSISIKGCYFLVIAYFSKLKNNIIMYVITYCTRMISK